MGQVMATIRNWAPIAGHTDQNDGQTGTRGREDARAHRKGSFGALGGFALTRKTLSMPYGKVFNANRTHVGVGTVAL